VRYGRDEAAFDRAIGFIDATFALALTLLITTIDVSDTPAAWRSFADLDTALGTQFIAFAIAFVVIARYWLAHHRMVVSFAAIDTPLIVANLGLVAAIILLPFSTQAVGDPRVEDLPLPTVVMAMNVAVASVMYAAVYALAYRRRLLAEPPTREAATDHLLAMLTPAAVFLGSVPIAYLVSPIAGQLFWLSLIPIGVALNRRSARIPDRHAGGEG